MLRQNVVAAFTLLASLVAAPASGLSQSSPGSGNAIIDRRAVVFIQLECVDPIGIPSEPSGSGFIIEETGYIATAHHVAHCWDPKARSFYLPKKISTRIGSPWEPPERPAEIVRTSEDNDVAILKFRGMPQMYSALQVCSLRNPKPETEFRAAGFPEGREYQPVPVMFGNSSGRFWSVTAPFIHGMSGGPVADQKGVVVGLVKGGLREVQAVRQIIPIHVVGQMIHDAAGITLRNCEVDPEARGPPRGSPSNKPPSLGPCKKGEELIVFTDYSVIPPRMEKRCG